MNAALKISAPVAGTMKAEPRYGYVGALVGHWRLREYDRRGEWWAVCEACGHQQLIRIVDDYLPRCRCCQRTSSHQRPIQRARYLNARRST